MVVEAVLAWGAHAVACAEQLTEGTSDMSRINAHIKELRQVYGELSILEQHICGAMQASSLTHTSEVLPGGAQKLWEILKSRGIYLDTIRGLREVLDMANFGQGQDYSLKHLTRLPLQYVHQVLTGVTGVGDKIAAVYLLFGEGRPDLPVDTHVARVLFRNGISKHDPTPRSARGTGTQAAARAYDDLVNLYGITQQNSWQDMYQLHQMCVLVGRVFCTKSSPRCQLCIFNADCPKIGVDQDTMGRPTTMGRPNGECKLCKSRNV